MCKTAEGCLTSCESDLILLTWLLLIFLSGRMKAIREEKKKKRDRGTNEEEEEAGGRKRQNKEETEN